MPWLPGFDTESMQKYKTLLERRYNSRISNPRIYYMMSSGPRYLKCEPKELAAAVLFCRSGKPSKERA